MLFNPNIFTEAEVLEILAAAKQAYKDGQRTVAWSNEGSSETLQNTAPPMEIIQECTAFLQALNPSKYGYRIKSASYPRC